MIGESKSESKTVQLADKVSIPKSDHLIAEKWFSLVFGEQMSFYTVSSDPFIAIDPMERQWVI